MCTPTHSDDGRRSPTPAGQADADGYQRYVRYLERLFGWRCRPSSTGTWIRVADVIGPDALRLLRMGRCASLDPLVGRFLTDDRLRRIFSFQAMYAGLAPQEALGIYAVISYMDCVRGVYFPRGGMHALPVALAAAATDHGVEIRYDTEVSRIEVSGGRATGVVTSSGERTRGRCGGGECRPADGLQAPCWPRSTPRSG